MMAILQVEQLNKRFETGKENEIHVLKDVDIEINEGEFLSVMGPSGSGKSTLLYNISGLDRMTSGSVVFNGQELSALSEKELAEVRLRDMGFVFQHIHLLKNLSIFDNIILPAYMAQNGNKMKANRRAKDLMETVGISDLAENDVNQASGGQLQRVGICRALINQPSIVFGDEPTGALNSKAAGEIMDLLAEINRAGTTILLVTHNAKVAARTERVLFMIDGEVVAQREQGKYQGNGRAGREREEALSSWLLELGF
jgi:putative ABC transport system ATP-binding protein